MTFNEAKTLVLDCIKAEGLRLDWISPAEIDEAARLVCFTHNNPDTTYVPPKLRPYVNTQRE